MHVPVKVWSPLTSVEGAALQQLKNMATLPFVFKHVAAMPDVHLGIGATVGSVVATQGAVIPAAVGVDIGCGMMAVQVKADLHQVKDQVKKIRHAIERVVPAGFDENRNLLKDAEKWKGWSRWSELHAVQERNKGGKDLYKKARHQLGSLGGGNHFVELCEDKDGGFWVMLHSGSRGIGNQVARMHIEKAKSLIRELSLKLPDPDLAYFTENTKEYKSYLQDLMWCQNYARENREIMMARILSEISRVIGSEEPLEKIREVNCHHNYAAMENHYGENVLVTRKGAVRAQKGELGIIPGSMGTRSYIVEGLGNPASFQSCSHGAGRRMSRNQAKKSFTLKDLRAQTEGVECRKDQGVLDEIPGAYKDIDEVMENQKDLVRVVAQLKQFMCVKG